MVTLFKVPLLMFGQHTRTFKLMSLRMEGMVHGIHATYTVAQVW